MKRLTHLALQAACWIILLGLCPACANKLPELIQHDPPELPVVDISPFIWDGCQSDYIGNLTCPEGSPPAALDCSFLVTVEPVLGGLQPAYPIVKCQLGYDRYPGDSGNFLFEEGCLDHRWVQYAILRDGQYQILPTFAEFQAAYAPIESPIEALSYAVAATGLDARFDLETPPEYRYEVEKIDETWVEETDFGYRIHLFKYSTCGCGPHFFDSIAVNVTRSGGINLDAPVHLFRDPHMDHVCGD